VIVCTLFLEQCAGVREKSVLALEAIFSLSSMHRAPSVEGGTSHSYAGTTFSTPRDDAGFLSLAGFVATSNRHAMARDDDDFRLRPGKIRDRGRARVSGRRAGVRTRPTSFTGQIQQAIRRAGGDPSRLNEAGKGSNRFNARGRGAAVATALRDRSAWSREAGGVRTRSRRVAVKARVVKLNPQRGGARGWQFVGAKAVDAHLRYLQRDGVTKDGEKGQVYSASRDIEDGRAFVERGREDRHQFRFIVSAEDGVALADPRTTTRDLMNQMEDDLGTRLAWIAVDHHNTGRPHTHIIVRGVAEDGKTLNIAGDYIAYGIRERASEAVTRELGRQTEQEVSRSLEREVDADRFTRLDRMLIGEQRSRNEFADLRPDRDRLDSLQQNRALLILRARKLERMGLATEVESGRWTVSPRAEPVLRELGERGDIIKSMHRALDREGLADARSIAGYVLHQEKTTEPIVGRVLDKGLGGDEMGERVRLVIDGVDGRVHHLEMDPARAEDIQRGMIVAAGASQAGPRVSDRNILGIADKEGIYRPARHLEQAVGTVERLGGDPAAYVRSHVRRLEALRRAGHVERIDADQWRIPADLSERGRAYDLARDRTQGRIAVLSPAGLDQQIGHDGATWLDHELASRERTVLADDGFGREVTVALVKRRQWLADRGYAADIGGGRIRTSRDLVQRLKARDLERIGRQLAAERKREWRPAVPGNQVSGQLVGSTQLPSGRFAMIDDGLGFSLVPWRPALEQHVGRAISGVALPGGDVNWSFGRKRGLGL
jgi:type IV secretory pathway VirD2 relaxase